MIGNTSFLLGCLEYLVILFSLAQVGGEQILYGVIFVNVNVYSKSRGVNFLAL